jgi:hypothetical protein
MDSPKFNRSSRRRSSVSVIALGCIRGSVLGRYY